MDTSFDISINISVSIPIIGDSSIMLAQPPAGFEFKEIPIDEYIYSNRITDSRGEVMPEYRSAIHSGEKPYVICMEMTNVQTVKHDKPANAVSFFNGSDFDKLIEPIHDEIEATVFRFFSLLHLFKEGEIARKHSFYSFNTQSGICKVSRTIDSYIEDIITLIRYPLIIDPTEVPLLNDLLYKHERAYQILKLVVIDDLEYTYHTLDDATNYKNMMTPLEVMFLQNDYGDKKEMLAKRMAVFLGNSDCEMKSIYDNVKSHYRDRSEAVHEGSTTQISHASVDELRGLVRSAAKKYIGVIEQALKAEPAKTFDEIKTEQIGYLKGIVQIKNGLNIW